MATAITLRSPGLAPPTGTTFRGTRTGTSAVASLVRIFNQVKTSITATALMDDLKKNGQPLLSCFGEYTSWFGERGLALCGETRANIRNG